MDAVYDRIGCGYASLRQPDPRIAARIDAALAGCDSVVNVGAGTGSYEPLGRTRLAIEPSAIMVAQRAAAAAPCVRGCAEALPLPARAVDACLAVLTMHHWSDWRIGLAEMARVSRRRVVVFTWDKAYADALWLVRDYLPESQAIDDAQFPDLGEYDRILPGVAIEPVPVPHDCSDGFFGAYWRRPQAYLDATVRSAISTCDRLPAARVDAAMAQLRADLDRGVWQTRYADLLARERLDLGYRLLIWQR